MIELLAPLASPHVRLRYRLDHLVALRTVLLKLTPHFALYKTDNNVKERIAAALVEAAAARRTLSQATCALKFSTKSSSLWICEACASRSCKNARSPWLSFSSRGRL